MNAVFAAAKVPASTTSSTKGGGMALAQIDAALAYGVHFDVVLTDHSYGSSTSFRAGLTQRELR